MANLDSIFAVDVENSNNKVGTFESMLSGVASGLIAIPKGFFSLGASLMDLGVNSGKAARVEAWFDHLPELFSHVRKARRHDRHGGYRGSGIRADL